MTEVKINHTDEVPLKEGILMLFKFLRYLLSKWYIIILFTVVGGFWVYNLKKADPVLYKASTTFVLENTAGGNVSGMAAILGVGAAATGQGLFQGESLFELYKSRKLIQEVLLAPLPSDTSKIIAQRLAEINVELEERVNNNGRIKKFLSDKNNLLWTKPGEQRLRDSILNVFVKHVRNTYLEIQKPNKEANIIQIDVTSENEEFSKVFNETLVRNVNALFIQMKSGKSAENISLLQHKVDSVRRIVASAMTNAIITIDNTPNLNMTRQAQRNLPVQQSQFILESNKSVLAELQRNLETSKITMSRESPLIETLDEAIYPLEVIYPNPKIWTIIGVVFSFILAVGVILLFYSYKQIMREN